MVEPMSNESDSERETQAGKPASPTPSDIPAGFRDRWSPNTKLLASLVFLTLVGLSFWRFRHLLQPIVIAVVIAYLLHPLVTRLSRAPFLSRTLSSVLVLAAFLLTASYLFIWLGLTAFTQLDQLLQDLPRMVINAQAALLTTIDSSAFLQSLLSRPELQGVNALIRIADPNSVSGMFNWDSEELASQALAVLNPVLRQSGAVATHLARGTFQALSTGALIVILALYVIADIPRVGEYIGRMAPVQGVQHEMRALWRRFSLIWGAYLRGQINIALIMFAAVSTLLALLGVKNAVSLGLLAGAMEFLPLIGPVVSFGVAVLAVFFQGSTLFGLSPTSYTLLVAAALLIVNLLESNVLVPRILGSELRLHPLVVLISVLMGVSLAGVLGAILAAPVAASLKLLGTYAWFRILDEPPLFLLEEEDEARPSGFWMGRLSKFARRRSNREQPKNVEEQPEPAEESSQPGRQTD